MSRSNLQQKSPITLESNSFQYFKTLQLRSQQNSTQPQMSKEVAQYINKWSSREKTPGDSDRHFHQSYSAFMENSHPKKLNSNIYSNGSGLQIASTNRNLNQINYFSQSQPLLIQNLFQDSEKLFQQSAQNSRGKGYLSLADRQTATNLSLSQKGITLHDDKMIKQYLSQQKNDKQNITSKHFDNSSSDQLLIQIQKTLQKKAITNRKDTQKNVYEKNLNSKYRQLKEEIKQRDDQIDQILTILSSSNSEEKHTMLKGFYYKFKDSMSQQIRTLQTKLLKIDQLQYTNSNQQGNLKVHYDSLSQQIQNKINQLQKRQIQIDQFYLSSTAGEITNSNTRQKFRRLQAQMNGNLQKIEDQQISAKIL